MREAGKTARVPDKAGLYAASLAASCGLAHADASLAGMPLRTLLPLAAGFLCLAARACAGDYAGYLPGRGGGRYGRAALASAGLAALLLPAAAGTGWFWGCADALALLLAFPCLLGMKRFPRAVFPAHGICAGAAYALLLAYYLGCGACGPPAALLLRDGEAAPWLAAGITVDLMAFAFEERLRPLYGACLLAGSFLLFLQGDACATAAAGAAFLLPPLACRPSAELVRRTAAAGFMYAYLLCSMPLAGRLIPASAPAAGMAAAYGLEAAVWLELLLAGAALWFSAAWDRHAQGAGAGDALPGMRRWYGKAAAAYAAGLSGLCASAGAPALEGAARSLLGGITAGLSGEAGLCGWAGGRFGLPGTAAACAAYAACAVCLCRSGRWRVRGDRLCRMAAAAFLAQGLLLRQTMASLPVCAAFAAMLAGRYCGGGRPEEARGGRCGSGALMADDGK